MNGIHIIQYPTGRYGFVGRVPADLAYNSTHAGDLYNAQQSGPRIASLIAEREGRTFTSLSWATRKEAIDYAQERGYTVT